MEGEGCLSRREKSSLTVHSLSIHARERKSERRERKAYRGGGGGDGFSERIERLSNHLLPSQIFRSALASIFLAILSLRSTMK